MVKLFRNKKFLQKIIILIVILTSFNFICPISSHATEEKNDEPGMFDFVGQAKKVVGDALNNLGQNILGGLTGAVGDLIRAIGDAGMQLMQIYLLPDAPVPINHNPLIDSYANALLKEENIDKYPELKEDLEKVKKDGDTVRNIDIVKQELKEYLTDNKKSENITDEEIEQAVTSIDESRLFPLIIYTPRAIFSNIVPLFDVNFINPKIALKTIRYETELKAADNKIELLPTNVKYELIDEPTDTMLENDGNAALILSGVIASWYKALRNIAIIVSLSTLVYAGIRIILSSVASEKAEYKNMLKDWFIGLCLILSLHYIMAFSINIVEAITNGIAKTSESTMGGNVDTFVTDIRWKSEYLTYTEGINKGSEDQVSQIGYAIMYGVIVFYTALFSWKYIKRFLYMAFLTIISPLIAVTYAIDKVKDNEAQSFNMWVKEYLINLAIQPFHLLMYTILLSSAARLAETNALYGIAVIAFMNEIEKLIKQFFGLNKAQGGGISSPVLTGATAAAGFNAVQRHLGGKGNKEDNSDLINNRTANSDVPANLAEAYGNSASEAAYNANEGGDTENVDASPSQSDNYRPSEEVSNTPENENAEPIAIPESEETVTPNSPKPKASARLFNLGRRAFGAIEQQGFSKAIAGGAKGAYDKGVEKFKNIPNAMTQGLDKASYALPDAVETAKRKIKGIKDKGIIKSAAGYAGRKIDGAERYWSTNGARLIAKARKGAKKATILGVKATTATTGAALGLIGGLASDNPGAIWKGVVAGAGAGWALGGAGTKMTFKAAKGTKDIIRRRYDKEGYERAVNKESDRAWLTDKNTEKHYKEKYGRNWKTKMAQGLELRKQGITDQSEIDKGTKLMDNGLSAEKAGGIMNLANGMSKSDIMKDPDKIKNGLKRIGLNENQVNDAFGHIQSIYKIPNNQQTSSTSDNTDPNNDNNSP